MAFNSKSACIVDYNKFISEYEDGFKALGCATRVEIKDLFSNNSYEKYTEEELAKLDYQKEEVLDMKNGHWGLQVWKKMSVRFNNCKCDTAVIWNQLSPNYRSMLLSKYKIIDLKYSEIQNYVMNFFVWISCSLAFYSVKDILESEEIADNWTNMTCISWYISLDDKQKDIMVAAYKKYLEHYL